MQKKGNREFGLEERLKRTAEKSRKIVRKRILAQFSVKQLNQAAKKYDIKIPVNSGKEEIVDTLIETISKFPPDIFCARASMEYEVRDVETRAVRAIDRLDAREKFRTGDGLTLDKHFGQTLDLPPDFSEEIDTTEINPCTPEEIIKFLVLEKDTIRSQKHGSH